MKKAELESVIKRIREDYREECTVGEGIKTDELAAISARLGEAFGFAPDAELLEFLSLANGFTLGALKIYSAQELIAANSARPEDEFHIYIGELGSFICTYEPHPADYYALYEDKTPETVILGGYLHQILDCLADLYLCMTSPYFRVKPRPYEDVYPFSGGLAAVKYKGKWGCVDKDGKMAIPAIYDSADSFSRRDAGPASAAGEEVTALDYDELERFDGGFAEACLDGKWGLVDKTGKAVIPIIYEDIIQHDGLVAFRQDGKWGLMDTAGKVLAAPRYSRAYIYDKNTVWVREGEKCGVISPDGREIIPVIYDDLHIEGTLMGACLDGKYGYIDRTGNVAIPFIYDEADEFADGRAMVGLDGKCGMIDTDGKLIVPFEYSDINYDTDENSGGLMFGYKGFGKGKKMFLLDKNGKTLLSIIPDRQNTFSEGMAWVSLCGGKLWGAVGYA
ncbi:MAG: WG repeat-containing protein [Oscillospiraceae bacterium]|nr:WG repeat-containing protein [Oscillospiraceae bacterium]